MDSDHIAWGSSEQAWRRLLRRGKRVGSADGGGSLDALSDIGVVRRMLDHLELTSVREARRHGKSWAEIATSLGVSRQSAWERWRDLDEAPTDEFVAPAPADGLIDVPDVLTLTASDARTILLGAGLVPMLHTSGRARSKTLGPDINGVVVDQVPKHGARRRPGSQVTLWVEGGGPAGVREPRRPKPSPVEATEAEPLGSEVDPMSPNPSV